MPFRTYFKARGDLLALQPFTAWPGYVLSEFGPAAEYFQLEYVEGLCAGEEGLKCVEFKLWPSITMRPCPARTARHGREGRDRPVFALAVETD